MHTDVAVLQPHEVIVTTEQTELIKKTICQGATDGEMKLFFFDCQRRGVHPLDKLIHFTKRDGKYTPVTSIDFFRLRAHSSGAYAGEGATTYELGEDGLPNACTVSVLRLVQGQLCTWRATARWDEYYPGEKSGFMWKKMPFLMLAKCAEALALRKAFPAELQGLYVKEEMDQAGAEQRPLRTPSQILAESEQTPQQTPGSSASTLPGQAAAGGTDVKSEAPTLLPAYLDQIGLSQSVAECSKTLNTALKDETLTVLEVTELQEAGKQKILALRVKK